MNKRTALVVVWGLVMGALLVHNLYLFCGGKIKPDTDIMALLPVQDRDPVLQKAFAHMVEATEQRVIVLIGAPNWQQAVTAADTYTNKLTPHTHLLRPSAQSLSAAQEEWLDLFYQNRLGLLTSKQRKHLETQPAAFWTNTALTSLYTPMGNIRISAWQDDPFGLFSGWMQERAQETPIRTRDGKLFVRNGQLHYVVLPLTLQISAFSIEEQKDVVSILSEAKSAAAETSAHVEILTGGIILHTAAATEQATWEISTIGIGSMVGIFLLIVITFRSLKPILLISFSLLVGLGGALSVCYLVYDKIHILTLVFGASLAGVAQDYGIYFLCNRSNTDVKTDSWRLLHALFPSMGLTFLTTVVAYFGMLLTPFPGMHQMALFSVCGLTFSWLTIICWFPFLVSSNTLKRKPGLNWYKRSIFLWPIAKRNKYTLGTLAIFACFCVMGLSRLAANDDIRLLQMPNTQLMEEQKKIGTLLGIAAPAQFYLVRAETPELLLQKEEALRTKLDTLIEEKTLSGYQALSSWIPSIHTQKVNQDLIGKKLLDDPAPLQMIQRQIGADRQWQETVRGNLLKSAGLLEIKQFLELPGAESLRHLWLEMDSGQYASMVTLKGVSINNLQTLAAVTDHLDDVQWIDKVDEISTILGYYRQYLGWVTLLSYGIVFAFLFCRYKWETWRVMLPTILASLATLAFFGISGTKLQLFHMLAFMLILGIGVDYSIFLQENVTNNLQSVWLEIGLSVTSTILGFGLLSLSNTPALRAFGLTLLIALFLIWILVPLFRKEPLPEAES